MNTLPLHVIYHCILPFKVEPIFGVNKEWDNHEKELIRWKKEVIIKDKVYEYAEKGRTDHVKFCVIEHGSNDWNRISATAAQGGHKDIVDDMIERGANDWHRIAYCAAFGGHKDILDDLIERGANDWNSIAFSAASGGHKDILDDMIEHGANNWNYIAHGASLGGYKELANEIREKYIK